MGNRARNNAVAVGGCCYRHDVLNIVSPAAIAREQLP